MKPYYEHAGITIYHGDCREILPRLQADAVISDPPYNCGKIYGAHNDNMEPGEYITWLSGIWAMCDVRTLIYTPGDRHLWDTPQIVNEAGFVLGRPLAWHKKEFAGDKWSGGPAICWEPVIWAYRESKFFNRMIRCSWSGPTRGQCHARQSNRKSTSLPQAY